MSGSPSVKSVRMRRPGKFLMAASQRQVARISASVRPGEV